MNIPDREKRRARNIIWNAAREYGFEPPLKVFDPDGRADLYWNSIIGAARRCYGAETVDALFDAIRDADHEEVYEQLLWLGLENAVYQRETPNRPALPALRRRYARQVIARSGPVPTEELPILLEEMHFRRVLGEEVHLMPRERDMLDELELPGDLSGEELTERLLAFLGKYYHFTAGEGVAGARPPLLRRFFRRITGRKPPVRRFGRGYSEHTVTGHDAGASAAIQRRLSDQSLAQSEATIRKFVEDYFGEPLLDPGKTAELEHELCTDAHQLCHLYFARGEDTWDPSIRGFANARRKEALARMQLNRDAYAADAERNRESILRLTARIRNAMLAYLQPETVRSPGGTLDGGRVWRGVYLRDDKIFTRVQQTDPGELSVDILLDGSTSQQERQTSVAAQGYMIAEALTRCHIPVRVSSFCSISGYTVVTRYRDYHETDRNEKIFNYFTAGCNRDGLALRALRRGMDDSPCEHKLLILLSDAQPNDITKMEQDGEFIDYTEGSAVQNTAIEVRGLTGRGVSVICVFTGEDTDLPAAHTIYGRNFARIRSLDQFADTVGTLIQNQIRSI